jgi:hypothetical protein
MIAASLQTESCEPRNTQKAITSRGWLVTLLQFVLPVKLFEQRAIVQVAHLDETTLIIGLRSWVFSAPGPKAKT